MGVIIMARRTVEEIKDDFTGETFYASNDGLTTVPYVVTVNGEEKSYDVAPSTREALDSFFSGDASKLQTLLNKVNRPSNGNGNAVDAALKVKVSEYIASLNNGVVPGRVTSGMVERYQLHLHAQEIIKNADAANAANADNSDDNSESADAE